MEGSGIPDFGCWVSGRDAASMHRGYGYRNRITAHWPNPQHHGVALTYLVPEGIINIGANGVPHTYNSFAVIAARCPPAATRCILRRVVRRVAVTSLRPTFSSGSKLNS